MVNVAKLIPYMDTSGSFLMFFVGQILKNWVGLRCEKLVEKVKLIP